MTDRTRFTAFITKYALSRGIFQAEVDAQFDRYPHLVWSASSSLAAYHGGDWHRTRETAIARAEKMRRGKIASLKKQIARLEKIDFEKTTPGGSDV